MIAVLPKMSETIVVLGAVLAQSLAFDCGAITDACLHQGLFRTTSVLMQDIALRAENDRASEVYFRWLMRQVPRDRKRPRLNRGYDGPDDNWPGGEIKVPRGTRGSNYRWEVNILPYWESEQWGEALKLPTGPRLLQLSAGLTTERGASAGDLSRTVLALAERWRDDRLLAGFLLDLTDQPQPFSAEALRVVLESRYVQSRLAERIPAGCDTHFVSLEAFRLALHQPEKSPERTIGELIERVWVLTQDFAGPPNLHTSLVWALEQPLSEQMVGSFRVGRAEIDIYLGVTYIEAKSPFWLQSLDWDALARKGLDPEASGDIEIEAEEKVNLRVFLTRALVSVYRGRARYVIGEDGRISLEVIESVPDMGNPLKRLSAPAKAPGVP